MFPFSLLNPICRILTVLTAGTLSSPAAPINRDPNDLKNAETRSVAKARDAIRARVNAVNHYLNENWHSPPERYAARARTQTAQFPNFPNIGFRNFATPPGQYPMPPGQMPQFPNFPNFFRNF